MFILKCKNEKIINLNNITYIESAFRKLIIHFIGGMTTTCEYDSDTLKDNDIESMTK